MNWYYRMMLSYAPIFFAIISSIILVLFSTLNMASKNKYIETSEAIMKQMVRYTEANLQLIERNVVSELYQNSSLQSFFEETPKTVYDYFLIQRDLVEFSNAYPFVISVYLYNESTGEFLTSGGKYDKSTFGDAEYFFSTYLEPIGASNWTDPRDYQHFAMDKTVKVVSSLKYYPYVSAKQGAIVINVHVNSILDVLQRLNHSDYGSVALLDSIGRPFQANMNVSMDHAIYAKSNYTGWSFYAADALTGGFSILSQLANWWTILGLSVIVLAIVWFTFITHRNYKPIQTIVVKINDYMARKSETIGMKSPHDLKYIEGAIDQLLKKTVDYDDLQKEGFLLRQRNLFQNLLTGHQTMTDKEYEREMALFGRQAEYDRIGVLVMEIDRYDLFVEQYSASDQYLLKYIVESVAGELAQDKGTALWHLWVNPRQLAAVIHWRDEQGAYPDAVRRLCEELRKWINDNLEMTLSIGIGKPVESVSKLAESYRHAGAYVSYKAVFGTNVIIDDELAGTKAGRDNFNWFHALLEMAHYLRSGNELWRAKLDTIFNELGQTLLSQADIVNFVSNLTHQLQKEISSLSHEFQTIWQERYTAQLQEISVQSETLGMLQERLTAVLIRLEGDFERERTSRNNHSIAVQIQSYIDRNYADPDLSLNKISDLFHVSPKSVSSLFKEELGEKFIDYILKVRLEHAKKMLRETDEPIQSIAEKVGYTHVISFHRAFKKQCSMTPGEYRNLYRGE